MDVDVVAVGKARRLERCVHTLFSRSPSAITSLHPALTLGRSAPPRWIFARTATMNGANFLNSTKSRGARYCKT